MRHLLSLTLLVAAMLMMGISSSGATAIHPALALDDDELECLALTIYWEARGLPMMEQEAVAFVAINRTEEIAFPDTICEVLKPGGTERYQCTFIWWCAGRRHQPQEPMPGSAAKSPPRGANTRQIPH